MRFEYVCGVDPSIHASKQQSQFHTIEFSQNDFKIYAIVRARGEIRAKGNIAYPLRWGSMGEYMSHRQRRASKSEAGQRIIVEWIRNSENFTQKLKNEQWIWVKAGYGDNITNKWFSPYIVCVADV